MNEMAWAVLSSSIVISFATFKCVEYIVDAWERVREADRNVP